MTSDATGGACPSPAQVLRELWLAAGGEPGALANVELTGADPALPSSFRVGTAAQTAIASAGLAAAEIWRRRTGRSQGVSVDMRHAAIEFRSELYVSLDGKPVRLVHDKVHGVYRTRDDRIVRIHARFPHHRDGVLKLLGCAHERSAVEAALLKWDAEPFEAAAAGANVIATMLRSSAEWAAHPQGQAVAALPLLEITRIGEAPARPFPAGAERPLSGIRALDLTRVIAGPVAGRTLAAHGADVMRITAPHLHGDPDLDIDLGRGKLSAALDLRADDERERLAALVRDSHIFVQSYRPGALAGLGFAPEALAEMRPGIIAVSLSAYGHAGPWARRRGFDSQVQNASGINHAEAEALGVPPPKELPAQALDHASGYLMAFGATMALLRKAREGGSWHVRVSLAQTGHWLSGLGRLESGFDCPKPTREEVEALCDAMASPFGQLAFIRHAASLSETPAGWTRPPVPLGTHAPLWPV